MLISVSPRVAALVAFDVAGISGVFSVTLTKRRSRKLELRA
jgi:hypothetical protein